MSKKIVWTCVLALLTAIPARAELLLDPWMNSVGANGQLSSTPNAPWVFTATRGGNPFTDGGASLDVFDHDGGGYGLWFKPYHGNPPWDPTVGAVTATIYQDVAGTAGLTYTLSGWWGAEPNYSGLLTPGANTIFGLDFLDGVGGLLASAELDLEAAGLGGPVFGQNWELFTLAAIAPAGTATVRARGTMVNGVFNTDPGQALLTDQWSLVTDLPEPTTTGLWLLGLGLLVVRRRLWSRCRA